ncbi:uncharacterized protein LOC120338815 [Styela clava]
MSSNLGVLIFFTILSTVGFIISLVVPSLSNIPNNGFFNNTIGSVSAKYPTDVTPADYAFSIWGLIYLFQIAWLSYAYSCMCRSNKSGVVLANPVVLPIKFHVAWLGTCVFVVLWTFYFLAEQILISAVCLLMTTLFGYACSAINAIATTDNEKQLETESPADLICIRVLIQNGLDLFFSWTTVATLIGLAMTLTYDPNVPKNYSQEDAGSICLYILGSLVILWSVLENTKFFSLFKYVYAWYFVLIWALSALIVKNPDVSQKNTIITIVILCVAVVCLAAKITVFCLRPSVAYKKVEKYQMFDTK